MLIHRSRLFCTLVAAATLVSCASKETKFDASAPVEQQAERYVKTDDADEVKGIKKVVIPYFQVEYIVRSSASATAWSGSGNSAQVSQVYELKGVTDETRQAMTDRMYEKLVDDLKAVGMEVMPYEEMIQTKAYKAFESRHKATPFDIERGGTAGKVYSYKGAPVYFDDGDKRIGVGKLLGQAFSMAKRPPQLESDLEKETGAKVLRARYIIDFASRSASTNRDVATVNHDYGVMLIPEGTGLTFKNDGAKFELKETVIANESDWVKDVHELNSGKNIAGSAISAMVGHRKDLKEYEIETNVPAWEKTVENTVASTQQMFLAKLKAEL